MATFAAPFTRLSFVGTLWGVDQWSINLSLTNGPAAPVVDQATLDAIRGDFKTHLMSAAPANVLGGPARLTYVKAARIGTDGKYMDAAPTISNEAAGGHPGTGTSPHAPQVALAVTLLGANPRGAAGRGRFFIPAPTAAIGVDGRVSDPAAQAIADQVAKFINAVNPRVAGGVSIVGPTTASGRAGASQPVTAVRVGRVFDTVRSRRSSFPEEPKVATITIVDAGGGGV